MAFNIIDPDPSQFAEIAGLWHRAWHAGHAGVVPEALMALRGPESFSARVADDASQMRVACQGGRVVGLCICKGSEMYQLFVAEACYGTGLAAALLTDAEARMAARGVKASWLVCAEDNGRAAAFYRKAGWRDAGREIAPLETAEGVFEIPVIRFDKTLG